MTFALTAPGTDIALAEQDGNLVGDGVSFLRNADQVWDLLRAERRGYFDDFEASYAAVRSAEQRALTPAEVRALPRIDPAHPLADMWAQRAASFDRMCALVAESTPGSLVDIGAGCGWLSAHFARQGWRAAAVDVTLVGGDGLAAAQHQEEALLLIRAEMEAMPFASNSIDLAIFNASLHYAGTITSALAEARRVVRPGGQVVVLDSPIFDDPAAGHAMVQEFADHAEQTLGIEAAPLEGPGFVTTKDLDGLNYVRHDQATGLRAHVHRWRGARRAGREVASRPIVITTIGDNA